MTDQQPKLEEQPPPWGEAEPERRPRPNLRTRRPSNAEATTAGLAYLLSQRRNRRWGHLALPWGEADAGVTARVLACLGELPPHFVSPSLQQAVDESLDWLQQARTSDGGWGYPGADDADSTAWAVIALKKNGVAAPVPALQFIRRCHRPDGGFAGCPDGGGSTPETTALAIQALGTLDPAAAGAAAGFLSSCLQSDGARLASPLCVCSGILEWEKVLAPLALLNQVCQLTACFHAESAWEQALLLRCFVRLRLNRAWSLAAGLRAMQLDDGSWPGPSRAQLNFDDKRIIPTATAVSALVSGEFQPGLYFGSDLPRPRRLHES